MRSVRIRLFFTFLKTGAFTFGGGHAMIALMERELVDKRHWMTEDEFMDMTAIAESTPGPIAVNSATYVGYRIGGIGGACLATLGVVLPSFVLIYLISLFFDQFLAMKAVSYAFRGIRLGVTLLILSAGLRLLRGLKKTPLTLCIFSVTFLGTLAGSLWVFNFSSVFYLLGGGLAGLVALRLTRWSKEGDKK